MKALKRSLSSLLDQVLLSALNFGIAFLLIQGIGKAEYGLYVQLWLFGLLATSIVDALLGNAFNSLNNRPGEERPPDLLRDSFLLALLIAGITSVLGFSLSFWWTRDWPDGLARFELAGAYAAYLFVLVGREFKRVCLYLTERWQTALWVDTVFAGLSVTLLVGLWWQHALNVMTVFIALGTASAAAWWLTPALVQAASPAQLAKLFSLAKRSWAVSSWALPGTVVGWSINNIYLFILGEFMGAASTAEANASKLAIMPLALTLVAWYQISRADISRLAQGGDASAFRPFVKKAALLMYAPIVLYVPVFVLMFPWLEPHLIQRGYLQMDTLIALWFVSALLAPVKFLGMSMLVGFEAFKPLFKLSVLSLVVQSVGVLAAARWAGLPYVLLALIVADAVEAAIMWFRLMPRYVSETHRRVAQ